MVNSFLIPINLPKIGEEEIEAVTKVMRSGVLTSGLGAGPKVTEFEGKYALFAGVKHAIAVNTGTAALHAALMAIGIQHGDEVILPSFTFVATAEAVVLAGARPVFVDIDPRTCNLSSSIVEKKITSKTKAVIPVDLYGLPPDMVQMRKIADKHGLYLVEDCAQSHGGSCEGKPAGALADLACWSLYAAKNIGTGEGGVVTTNNDLFAEKVRMFRTHGEKVKYNSIMLGTNYRMTEIQAAIGVVQLEKLPRLFAKRLSNAQRLSTHLKENKKLQLPVEFENRKSSWYLYTVRLRGASKSVRDELVKKMHEEGIGVEAYYPIPIHEMPYYREKFGGFCLPETEKAAGEVLSVPIHPGVTDEQIDFIAKTLLRLLN